MFFQRHLHAEGNSYISGIFMVNILKNAILHFKEDDCTTPGLTHFRFLGQTYRTYQISNGRSSSLSLSFFSCMLQLQLSFSSHAKNTRARIRFIVE